LVESDLKPSEALQLDELQFEGGSHFMANKKCNLPGGSYRKTKKGYEEGTPFFIPPLAPYNHIMAVAGRHLVVSRLELTIIFSLCPTAKEAGNSSGREID